MCVRKLKQLCVHVHRKPQSVLTYIAFTVRLENHMFTARRKNVFGTKWQWLKLLTMENENLQYSNLFAATSISFKFRYSNSCSNAFSTRFQQLSETKNVQIMVPSFHMTHDLRHKVIKVCVFAPAQFQTFEYSLLC